MKHVSLTSVEDLTRKLDDEKDVIKTLKRKHANNVKVNIYISVCLYFTCKIGLLILNSL